MWVSLPARLIEIRGEVKDYDGRAEIVLEKSRAAGRRCAAAASAAEDFRRRAERAFQRGAISRLQETCTTKKQSATLPIAVPEDAEQD